MDSGNQDEATKIQEDEEDETIDLTPISFFVVPGFIFIWILAALSMFIYVVANYDVFY